MKYTLYYDLYTRILILRCSMLDLFGCWNIEIKNPNTRLDDHNRYYLKYYRLIWILNSSEKTWFNKILLIDNSITKHGWNEA